MSPNIALTNTVFLTYLVILLDLLVVAGATIGILGLFLKKTSAMPGNRIAVG